jgi:chemotaxis protein methyltransferase CheR
MKVGGPDGVAAAWSGPDYQQLAELACTKSGLDYLLRRPPDAEAGIRHAMSRAGVDDVSEYLMLVRTGEQPMDDLVEELRVGESYFFREPLVFDALRGELLPELLRLRGPDHVVRAWSAGCAAGEEPYSLSILCHEEGLDHRVQILASDISRLALARAEAAADYSRWALRDSDEAFLDRYFTKNGGSYTLQPRYKARVQVRYLNLAEDGYPSIATGTWGMDLILCRNVLIYFSEDMVRQVARRFYECLAPGGWLIPGASDPPLGEHAPFETHMTRGGARYRRAPHELPSSTGLRAKLPAASEAPAPTPPRRTSSRPEPTRSGARSSRPSVSVLERARRALGDGDYLGALHLAQPRVHDEACQVIRVRAQANLEGAASGERAAATALVTHPRSIELRFLRAVLLLDIGREVEAVEEARRVLEVDPSAAIVHFTLGAILWRLGDLTGARRAFERTQALCQALPTDEVLPLSEGERAGALAHAAATQLRALDLAQEDPS